MAHASTTRLFLRKGKGGMHYGFGSEDMWSFYASWNHPSETAGTASCFRVHCAEQRICKVYDSPCLPEVRLNRYFDILACSFDLICVDLRGTRERGSPAFRPKRCFSWAKAELKTPKTNSYLSVSSSSPRAKLAARHVARRRPTLICTCWDLEHAHVADWRMHMDMRML